MGYKAANCTATQYQSTGVPAFLLLIQLTGDVLGKAVEDLPSMREATKHMDDQAEALGPWHQLGPNLAMATIQGVNHQMEDLLVFLSNCN